MAFFQDPPRLGNQYDDDPVLQEYLARVLPPEVLGAVTEEHRELGEMSGGELYRAQLADRLNEPVHTPWDPWGQRIDRIEVSPLWKRAEVIAAEHGLVGAAYEGRHGEHDRVHMFAMNHIVQPSLDVYSCPLAMTDGAARTLLDSGNTELIDRAVARLTSRDPARAWTSGQWMTERTGGSDVGLTETVAKKVDGQWRLYGTKWFTSATTSQMTLTLARPDGNGPGGRGLALFYLELRDASGRLNNIVINRLKDKLGTRKVPTAELSLEGTPAIPVGELANGTRNITPMLNVTRTWNAVCAASGMRRGIALARDFARRRRAFGDLLIDKPLHADTLAEMVAEADAAFLLAFRAVELMGRIEHGVASDRDRLVARVLTPVAKLTTGKQAVSVASEVLECFGGAGYIEDTGLPRLLADAQVLPIWEGTTNVLSMDMLRAMGKEGTFDALSAEIAENLAAVSDGSLKVVVEATRKAATHAAEWVASAFSDPPRLEAGARRFALTVGRATEAALLARHAQWCLDNGRGPRAAASARRFARNGVDRIRDARGEIEDSRLLA